MPQRIVVIGDIGVVDGMIHIGDEAMFEAAVDALRERGITDITGISTTPAESAERYKISAIRTLGGHRRFRAAEIHRFLEQVDESSVEG